ncbi:hypothetical protein OK016_12565 [Vibrio chagasii]|nr:hypothetical protein [Vibrio chagasii]
MSFIFGKCLSVQPQANSTCASLFPKQFIKKKKKKKKMSWLVRKKKKKVWSFASFLSSH